MKRFLYSASVTAASGHQVFFIDAASQEEADARAREGDSDGIHSEEVMVDDLSALDPCGETTLDDYGDFPPDDAQPTTKERT